jgi:hypothetical protein
MIVIHNGVKKDIDYHFASQLIERGLATEVISDEKPEKVKTPKPEKVKIKKK